ncbi:hypothetical protein [Pendulispora albinea]|uniref:Lipoprotein n=1 Tax=Pendulispora albinea TaxID=2741071 RepID=A0ABZ2M523_9BACT
MSKRNPSTAMVRVSCVLVCGILAGCSADGAERASDEGGRLKEGSQEPVRERGQEPGAVQAGQEPGASSSSSSSGAAALMWNSLRAAALQDTLEDAAEKGGAGEALWSGVYLYSAPTSTNNYAWARGFTTNLPSLPECQWVDVGNGGVCQRVQCRPVEKNTSIGDVHILGTNPPVKLSPDSNGNYPTFDSTNALYSAGDPILALVTGNDDRRGGFIAFSFAPEPLKLTSPQYDPAVGLEVDRNADFRIAWTPSRRPEQAKSRINLYFGTADYSSFVNCGWPQRSGKGTVPAALLRDLPAGPGVLGFATMVKNVREPSSQTKRTELRLSTDVYVQGKSASGGATFK